MAKNTYQEIKGMGAPSKIAAKRSWDAYNRYTENLALYENEKIATDVTLKEFDKKGDYKFGEKWTNNERKHFINTLNEYNEERLGKWTGAMTKKERAYVNNLARKGDMSQVHYLMKDGGFDQFGRQTELRKFEKKGNKAPRNVEKAIAQLNAKLGATTAMASPGWFAFGLMYGQNMTEKEALKIIRKNQSKTNPNRMEKSPEMFTML